MSFRFGHRFIVPDMKRFVTTRAVSKKNSNIGFGNLPANGAAFTGCFPAASSCGEHGHVGVVGWMKISACRRFSSEKMGSKSESPR